MIGLSSLVTVFLFLQGPSPVGSYSVDLQATPKKSRAMVQALFGTSTLRMSPDGTFIFIGVDRQGFWRQEGPRTVLVFDGFFTIKEAVPDDILKQRQPHGELEGLVFRKAGEKLTLARHGNVEGPIVLVRQPKRATKNLLRIIDGGQEDKSTLAFIELYDEMGSRWPELLSIGLNKDEAFETRRSAAVMFKVGDNGRAADAVLLALRSNKFQELTEKQRVRIRRSLEGSFRETKDSVIARRAFENLAQMDDAYYLSTLAVKGRVESAIPKLLGWANNSKSMYQRIAAIDALADFGANTYLTAILPMLQDPLPRIQTAAAGFVLRVSDSPEDLRRAETVLKRNIDQPDWLEQADVVEAWERSGKQEVVRHLAAVLLSNRSFAVRRNAARALGKLGFRQAIPTLLEAKQRTDGPETLPNEASVRKAAAEALWKFDQTQLPRTSNTAFLSNIGQANRPSRFSLASRNTSLGSDEPWVR